MHCCDNCGATAGLKKDFLDPRRSHDVITAYTEKYYCSPECEQEIEETLIRQARYARLQ